MLACTLVQVNKRCRFVLSFSRDQLARADVAAEVFHGQQIDSGSFGAALCMHTQPLTASVRRRAASLSAQACHERIACNPTLSHVILGNERSSMPAWVQRVHAQCTASSRDDPMSERAEASAHERSVGRAACRLGVCERHLPGVPHARPELSGRHAPR